MNKKYLSALLFGALTFASTATFTSCKDYDDDIDNLSGQINSLKEATEGLKQQIQAGKLITSVTPTSNGIIIEMSDGQKFEITNGKNGNDGKPGSVVEIGDNGNWLIDGKDTGKPSKGADGKDGEDGKDGQDGKPGNPGEGGADAQAKYYEPGADGYWYEVVGDKKTKTEQKWQTEAAAAGGVVAIWGNDELRLQNVQGATTDIVIPFSALESLVFVPEFVLDGHEAMEYLYIPYKALTGNNTILGGKLIVGNANCTEKEDFDNYKISGAMVRAKDFAYVNPYNHKPYHMNPSNAVIPALVKGADGIGMSSDDLDFEKTRLAYHREDASGNYADAQPKGKYVGTHKGDLVLGISMKGTEVRDQSELPAEFTAKWANKYAENFAAIKSNKNQITMLAPSAKVTADNAVTANYAAVKASQFAVAALAYNEENSDKHIFKEWASKFEEQYFDGHGHVVFDKHDTPKNDGFHLYTSVTEAAENPATVELVYSNKQGINLNELIDVHFISNSTRPWNNAYPIHVKHTTDELAYYGLQLEFQELDFRVGAPNYTRQDKYTIIEKNAQGDDVIYPCDIVSGSDTNPESVREDKSKIGEGKTGVGRTPVVAVYLKDANGNVLEVGYIKFKITAPRNPLETAVFNLDPFYYQCETWSQQIAWHAIDKKLYDKSDFIDTKHLFERHYRADLIDGSINAVQYYKTNNVDKNGKPIYAPYASSKHVGTIRYINKAGDENSDVFEWFVTAQDYQNIHKGLITEGITGSYPEYTVTRMVHFYPTAVDAPTDGDANFAKEDIYMPITLTLRMPQGEMSNKYDIHWFKENSLDQDMALAERNYIHVHVEVPETTVEEDDARDETPRIRFDLNSAFLMNNAGIGYAEENQAGPNNLRVGDPGWEAENAPIVDFTQAPAWNTVANFAEFAQNNLVYYYYFTAKNHNKIVYDFEGTPHKLLVKNTTANNAAMVYGQTGYEYMNTEIYADFIAPANLVATIKHEVINPIQDKGQKHAAYLELANTESAKLILNNPKEWVRIANGVADAKELLETLDVEIGVVAFNGCDLNMPLANNTFGAEILKPVYTNAIDGIEFTDAKDGKQSVKLFDFVNFYDWRVYQFADHLNYYNFYGVESISTDVNEIRVDRNGQWVPLKEVSGDVHFTFEGHNNGTVPSKYATETQLRNHYGELIYNDNHGSIKSFEFEVPVYIKHYWSNKTLKVWVKGSKVNHTDNKD